jgi:hypothetical protein
MTKSKQRAEVSVRGYDKRGTLVCRMEILQDGVIRDGKGRMIDNLYWESFVEAIRQSARKSTHS